MFCPTCGQPIDPLHDSTRSQGPTTTKYLCGAEYCVHPCGYKPIELPEVKPRPYITIHDDLGTHRIYLSESGIGVLRRLIADEDNLERCSETSARIQKLLEKFK